MPLKDKEKRKEAARDRQRKHRQGVTQEGVTGGVTSEDLAATSKDNPETVPASYVQGITGKFKSLPKRDRYLKLTDGQVLDRLEQPEGITSGDFIQRMRYCNEAEYNYHPNQSRKGSRS